jgi:hypothetical protein
MELLNSFHYSDIVVNLSLILFCISVLVNSWCAACVHLQILNDFVLFMFTGLGLCVDDRW